MIDVRTLPTGPWEPSPQLEILHALSGRWRGESKTWLDADGDPEPSVWELEVHPILGGRFIRIDYAATAMGQPHAGELLLGHDGDRWRGFWMDSFHTGRAPMSCEGTGEGIGVAGTYVAGAERWGWRIEVLRSGASLLIRMVNIHPSGQEDHAVHVDLDPIVP